jgi:hypothetical protein
MIIVIASATCQAQTHNEEGLMNYFDHLKPDDISHLTLWTFATVVVWFILWKFRERILSGLEGENGKLEGSETAIFLGLWMCPPIVFYILFFQNGTYALIFEAFVMGYALTGRFIFDWALAIKNGQSKVEKVVDPEIK